MGPKKRQSLHHNRCLQHQKPKNRHRKQKQTYFLVFFFLKTSGVSDNIEYHLDLELYEEINKEESKYTLESRNIFLNLKKEKSGPHWPRLTKESKKFNNIAVDWQWYVDEDDEDEADKAGPQFGNEQGFPGFGGDYDEDDLGEMEDKPLETGAHGKF